MERLGFWSYLLLAANHDRKEFYLGRQKIVCNPGQIVTGRESLSAQTGLHSSKIQRYLTLLENENQIEQQMNSKFRIITLKNWETYQATEQQMNSNRTADEQQMNTNKKEKNVKNEKNTYACRPETKTLYDSIEEMCSQYQLDFNVSLKSLDVYVDRYVGKIRMKVEAQHCIAWLVGKNLRAVTTQRIGNWFKKASEIQKRDQLKQLEWKEAKNNPAFAAKLKDQEVVDSVNHFLQSQ